MNDYLVNFVYYSHRYGGVSENLDRAEQRVQRLSIIYGMPVAAPWIGIARRGATEAEAWASIEATIPKCRAIIFDLDGRDWSRGMQRELELAKKHGKPVEILL